MIQLVYQILVIIQQRFEDTHQAVVRLGRLQAVALLYLCLQLRQLAQKTDFQVAPLLDRLHVGGICLDGVVDF